MNKKGIQCLTNCQFLKLKFNSSRKYITDELCKSQQLLLIKYVNFLCQQGENDVRAFIDNGLKADDVPIPDGFARLVLLSTKTEGIRGARADVAYLINQAKDQIV
jgi:hypothetical protein